MPNLTTPQTDAGSVVANRILDLLKAGSPNFRLPVPLANFYYGDQEQVPGDPVVCVEAGLKGREMHATQNRTLNTIQTSIFVYHARMQQIQLTRLEADQLGEDIEQLLHANLQLKDVNGNNPIVIHGFVQEFDPTYVFRTGTLYRTVRMTHTATTMTALAP